MVSMSKLKTIQVLLLLLMVVFSFVWEGFRSHNVCVDLSSVSQLEQTDYAPEQDHTPHLLIFLPSSTASITHDFHNQRFTFSHTEDVHLSQLLSSHRIALPPPLELAMLLHS